jgi:hypothetical protein
VWPFDQLFNAGFATGQTAASVASDLQALPGDIEAAKVAAERFAVAVAVGLAVAIGLTGYLVWRSVR